MPVVINEIEIAVEVRPDNNAASATGSAGNALSTEDIIKECVEKVMEIINQKNER